MGNKGNMHSIFFFSFPLRCRYLFQLSYLLINIVYICHVYTALRPDARLGSWLLSPCFSPPSVAMPYTRDGEDQTSQVGSWSPSVRRVERRGEDLYFALDLPTRSCCLVQGQCTGAFIVHPRVIDENRSPIILGFRL